MLSHPYFALNNLLFFALCRLCSGPLLSSSPNPITQCLLQIATVQPLPSFQPPALLSSPQGEKTHHVKQMPCMSSNELRIGHPVYHFPDPVHPLFHLNNHKPADISMRRHVVVPNGARDDVLPAGHKSAQPDWDDGCFCATSNDDISITIPQVHGSRHKGIVGCGAGCADAVIGTHPAQVDAYQGSTPAPLAPPPALCITARPAVQMCDEKTERISYRTNTERRNISVSPSEYKLRKESMPQAADTMQQHWTQNTDHYLFAHVSLHVEQESRVLSPSLFARSLRQKRQEE